MMGITRKKFINYSVLPGVKPRLQEIFLSGFHYIPFFMALVYQAVRLLPPNHPYSNPANIGSFGIRHVIAEAANNLVISRKNIDQIILFVTLLVGIGMGLMQIVLLGVSLVSGPASASGVAMPTTFAGFFLTPAAVAPNDLAYMMFDLIFGIKGMFGSCVDPAVGGCLDANGQSVVDSGNNWIMAGLSWPYPIHEGLHRMFLVYSTGLLVVAALITLYFVVTVIMETMQTGTPFGKRFNKVWAPVRLVVAFGLLVPLSDGLNSSQYIVLYAAKFGSGFATNGWTLFNKSLTGNYLGATSANLVSASQMPEISSLLQFLFTAGTCWELEHIKNPNNEVWPYAVRDNNSADNAALIDPWFNYSGPFPQVISSYLTLINFTKGDKQVVISFGVKDDVNNTSFRGHVKPVCGQLIIPLVDPRRPGAVGVPAGPGQAERAAVIMQAFYFETIFDLWYNTFYGANGTTDPGTGVGDIGKYVNIDYPLNYAQRFTQWQHNSAAPLPGPDYRIAFQEFYTKNLEAALNNPPSRNLTVLDPLIGTDGALKEAIASGQWVISPALLNKGWAAAGIWYNKVAEMNGLLNNVAMNIPIPAHYPMVMENVAAQKKMQDQAMSINQRFKPQLANGDDVPERRPEDTQMAVAMWEAFNYWQKDGGATTTRTAITGNPILDFINQLMGTSGLYSMRKQANVHPLAQLVGIGRTLMEASTRNLTMATGSVLTAGMDSLTAKAGMISVSFFMTLVTMTLTAGFVLYYVVPFLPFIYFFFAVGGWFKGIFEAMVGAPLWALAHIRIDGDGLPGRAAVNGYFLIFEIFLRPILIIFGLLASISIFAAMVSVLNQSWDLVTANLSGFDVQSEAGGTTPPTASLLEYMRGPVDAFFFTIIYAVVVYMMGMSSFKLVDMIPNNIMRWIGQSILVFNDMKEDAAQGLVGTATIGSQQAFSQLGGAMKGSLQNTIKSTQDSINRNK